MRSQVVEVQDTADFADCHQHAGQRQRRRCQRLVRPRVAKRRELLIGSLARQRDDLAPRGEADPRRSSRARPVVQTQDSRPFAEPALPLAHGPALAADLQRYEFRTLTRRTREHDARALDQTVRQSRAARHRLELGSDGVGDVQREWMWTWLVHAVKIARDLGQAKIAERTSEFGY